MKQLTLDDFTMLKVIGKGNTSTVLQVRRKETNEIFAMKMIKKSKIKKLHQERHIQRELCILPQLDHQNIIKLYGTFETETRLYLILEYCPGGELFFHLSNRGAFNESTTKIYAAQLILALEYLHKRNIIYRDLKPENILLTSDGFLKLTDFGLAKGEISDDNPTNTLCGTPEYLAPEVIQRHGHGKPVDFWGLGIFVYEMLTGLPPFFHDDREIMLHNIRTGQVNFPSTISDLAKDFISKLLILDPDQRLGRDLRQHPWLADVDFQLLQQRELMAPIVPTIGSPSDAQNFDSQFTSLSVTHCGTSDIP